MNENILDQEQLEQANLKRRDLLPTWIKVFVWIFLLFSVLMPIALVLGIMGFNFSLALYGLETTAPLSLVGLLIMVLFGIKGATAFGLWTEKEWGVRLAVIDAIIGIVLCGFLSFIYPFIDGIQESGFSFKLELLILIPYLVKMLDIREEWSGGD